LRNDHTPVIPRALFARIRIAPAYAITTQKAGGTMIQVARDGYRKPVPESEDINAV
jgi:hypothetical protein